jgi:myo-inositol-1(or 4)-monophosphatase
MYVAARGAGATVNGVPMHVSATKTLGDATLATGFPYDLPSRVGEILGFFEDLIPKARAVRRFGSAALDLAWVAQGRYDGYWERGLKAWDMAAGILLVAEAGGVVTNYRGESVSLAQGECLAAPAGVHAEMVAVTRPRAS